VLVVAIFALELADPGSGTLWQGLYVIPVLIVAQERLLAGVAVAVLAVALGFAWPEIRAVDVGFGDHVVWAVAVLFVAWMAARGGSGGRLPSLPTDDVDGRRLEAQRMAGLGTWELDLASGEISWSEQYGELYGVDPNSFVSTREAFRHIVHHEDRQPLDDALDRIIVDGNTVEIRYRITRPSDGAERCIRSHITARSDSGGDTVRVFGTGQDVTDLVTILSPRESQILMLLAEGVSGEDIAEQLFLSPATVRTHVQNAMGKLGAHTRGEAIATALRTEEIGS